MDPVRHRYRFRYDMSFNDTPLTLALERRQFSSAVTIIKNSASDPDLLNEGPYERFPLYIVMSGKYSGSELLLPNLQIAQLLLEHGADANKRGTVFSDMESYGRSASPMELLVDVFRNMQLQNRYRQVISPVIGLDGLVKVQYDEVRNHLLSLMKVFISHGGQLNFQPSILGVTQLLDILWTSPDADFLQCLYQAGVNMNRVDVHGRTALHLLCQVDYPPELEKSRLEAISYLLEHTNIKASKYSCREHSCLFYALKHYRYEAASLLLSFYPHLDQLLGAKAFLSAEPATCDPEIFVEERIPAVLIPFVPARDSKLRPDTKHFLNSYVQERMNLKQVAKLVDQGYFCNDVTDIAIVKLMDWNSLFRMHRKMLTNVMRKDHLVPLLFGRTSSKLKVLCARKIFQTCLHVLDRCFGEDDQVDEELGMDFEYCSSSMYAAEGTIAGGCNLSRVMGQQSAVHHLCISSQISMSVFDVCSEDLAVLLESLKLPTSFRDTFEFELYRRKLLILLLHSDSDRLKCPCLAYEQMRLDGVNSEESSTESESGTEEEEENNNDGSSASVSFLH